MINHQDIALWTSSVSESQDFGSFSHQDSLQDLFQATDLTLPGSFQSKEDYESDLSSMEDSAYMSQPDVSVAPSHSDVNSTTACPHSSTMATDYVQPLAVDAMGFQKSNAGFVNRHMMSVPSDSSFPIGSVNFSKLADVTTLPFDSLGEPSAKNQLTANYEFSPSDLVFGDLDWDPRPNHQTFSDPMAMQGLGVHATQRSSIAHFQADFMDPYSLPDNPTAGNRTNSVSGVIQQLPVLSIDQRKSQASVAPPVQTLSYKSGPYVPIRPQVQPNADRTRIALDTNMLAASGQDSLPGSSGIQGNTNKGTTQGGPRDSHDHSLNSK